MDRKVVVQLLDFVPNGGRSMDRFLISLAERMREDGWDTVFVFAGEPNDIFREQLEALPASFVVCKFPGSLWRAIKLGWRLRDYHASALQTHFISKFERNLLPFKLASGIRQVIVTDHSSGTVSRKSGVLSLLARWRARIAASYIDRVVAVSQFVRRRDVVETHFPDAKVTVVHNGVDIDRFAVRAPTPQTLFTVAYAGQLIPQKGVLGLIRAVQMLLSEGESLRLRIAGTGAQEAELKAYCDSQSLHRHVEFLGHIDGIERFFGDADVVVVPSEWAEAFGFVVAEAAACGACLVVSDAGGLPEVIGSDGSAGLVFRRGDAAHLAEQLLRLKRDPALRQRLRAGAAERAHRLFSLERMVEGHAAQFAASPSAR